MVLMKVNAISANNPSVTGPTGASLLVARLGRVDYLEAWQLQRRLTEARRANAISDVLLLLEHPSTYTLGRKGTRDHVLLPEDELARRGVAIYDVDRGGDVTYHGPGQLVGYLILKLSRRRDFVQYIRTLELGLLNAIRELGVDAELLEGYSGIWVGPEKVCAIGVKIDAWGVTSHGFGLNIRTDLDYFGHIIPCGIPDKGVTTLENVLGRRLSWPRVERAVVRQLCAAFELETAPGGRRRLKSLLTRLDAVDASGPSSGMRGITAAAR